MLGYTTTSSQAQVMEPVPYKHLELGPFFTAGASIFQGDVPDGTKTDIHFAYTGGALVGYSFHPHWGAMLGIGYESRGMKFYQQDNKDFTQNITLNYITIQPSVRFKQFLLGVSIGMPSGGTEEIQGTLASGSTGLILTGTSDVNKDNLATLIDIRIGALIPIVESNNGNLDFMIQACYSVSDAFNAGHLRTVGQTTTATIDKSPLPSLQLGITYLFAPMGNQ